MAAGNSNASSATTPVAAVASIRAYDHAVARTEAAEADAARALEP